MELVFIAIPTSGTVRDGALTERFLKFFANLHRAYPEKAFLCPMIQDYAILKYLPDVDATWDAWGDHCARLIQACDAVWVPKFDGWMESVGVQAEIGIAQELKIPVSYIIMNNES